MEAPLITNVKDHLRLATSAFITFLYAAAVHIVLHRGHEHGLANSAGSSFGLFVLVLFFLTDWLSRTRLPALVKDPVSIVAQLVKTILDLLCLYLLLIAALTCLDFIHNPTLLTGRTTFFAYVTAFLVATFLWNLQMFRIMKALSWWELLVASVQGNAVKMDATAEYGLRYLKFKNDLIGQKNDTGKVPLITTAGTISAVLLGGLVPQLVAIHLSIGNIALGGALVGHALKGTPGPLAELMPDVIGGLVTRFAASLTSALGHPGVAIVLGLFTIGLLASVQHVRTKRFWPWMLPSAGIMILLVLWHDTRPYGVLVGWLFAAFVIPGFCFLLGEESIDSAIPEGRAAIFRSLGSIALIVEYLLLLILAPAALVPLIALIQHFSVNFILQYAATPVETSDDQTVGAPVEQRLGEVRCHLPSSGAHIVVVSIKKE